MARVHLTKDARDDLVALDRSAQALVIKALKKLSQDPAQRGAALAGQLSGYRKLVVGDRAYRIIYRVEENGEICVAYVIGRRANDEVYKVAATRLAQAAPTQVTAELGELLDEVNRLQHWQSS